MYQYFKLGPQIAHSRTHNRHNQTSEAGLGLGAAEWPRSTGDNFGLAETICFQGVSNSDSSANTWTWHVMKLQHSNHVRLICEWHLSQIIPLAHACRKVCLALKLREISSVSLTKFPDSELKCWGKRRVTIGFSGPFRSQRFDKNSTFSVPTGRPWVIETPSSLRQAGQNLEYNLIPTWLLFSFSVTGWHKSNLFISDISAQGSQRLSPTYPRFIPLTPWNIHHL